MATYNSINDAQISSHVPMYIQYSGLCLEILEWWPKVSCSDHAICITVYFNACSAISGLCKNCISQRCWSLFRTSFYVLPSKNQALYEYCTHEVG